RFDLVAADQRVMQVEVRSGREMGEELAALVAVIQIERRDPHVMQLEGRRVAEDQYRHERRSVQHEARLGIAQHLDELLDQHVADAVEHRGYSILFLKVASAIAPNPAASSASAANCGASAAAPSPLRNT